MECNFKIINIKCKKKFIFMLIGYSLWKVIIKELGVIGYVIKL